MCWEGPQEKLTCTEHAQPALFVCGVAAAAVLRAKGVEPDTVAGHSVGELATLHVAGVVDFEPALRAMEVRAQLMAGIRRPGTMAAVIGLDDDVVAGLCASDDGPVALALHNGPRSSSSRAWSPRWKPSPSGRGRRGRSRSCRWR